MAKLHLGLGLLLLGGVLAWSCSPTEGNSNFIGPGTGGTAPGIGNGGTPAGNGTGVGLGTGGSGVATGTDGKPLFRGTKVCGADGVCRCLNFVSFGAAASKSYGTGNDSTNEFENWLVTKSNVNVSFLPNKQTLTADFLKGFDVILLQDLRSWGTFTAEEVAAFQAWIEGGGGVIALSGYFSDGSAEIVPTNALLAGTGMSLLATEVPGQTCDPVNSSALCPNSKASVSPKCYCWGNSLPLTEWAPGTPFATSLTAVGSFRGRAVSPGDGSTVVSYMGTPVAAYKPVGLGKVFIFGDEWVTYTSQWSTGGQATMDPYNPCWNESVNASCLAGTVFQAKQFWYNTILNVSAPSECTFVIDEPEVVIIQ